MTPAGLGARWQPSGQAVVFNMPEVRTRPERLHTAMPLACVGGFLDAYTFVGYNGVFANAQTANIVLLGVDVQAGHWR